MKYVSAKYEAQLHELADSLLRNKQLKLGEVAVTEPVFPHGLTRKDPVEHGWNMASAEPEGAQILKFPMAEVVELHVPDNIQLGQE
jgi:hypothetical protein